jgi:hypothetical protein
LAFVYLTNLRPEPPLLEKRRGECIIFNTTPSRALAFVYLTNLRPEPPLLEKRRGDHY